MKGRELRGAGARGRGAGATHRPRARSAHAAPLSPPLPSPPPPQVPPRGPHGARSRARLGLPARPGVPGWAAAGAGAGVGAVQQPRRPGGETGAGSPCPLPRLRPPRGPRAPTRAPAPVTAAGSGVAPWAPRSPEAAGSGPCAPVAPASGGSGAARPREAARGFARRRFSVRSKPQPGSGPEGLPGAGLRGGAPGACGSPRVPVTLSPEAGDARGRAGGAAAH